MAGYFCVSLDTELYWGVHDTGTLDYIENVRIGREKAIPEMLRLFEKYRIHTTWAIVGAAFAETLDELKKFIPPKELQPSYSNDVRSPYHLFDEHIIDEDGERLSAFLGGKDIEKIQSVPYQEIATHTFSHYYCKETGQTVEQFKADLKAAVEISKDKGIELKSIVYPKNEIEVEYLKASSELGIEAYRGIENNWIYNSNMPMILKKLLRFADAYFPISGPNCHNMTKNGSLYNLCASRILKPYNKKLSFLEPLKLKRIKRQMLYAAKNDKLFHIWWHPHNFGANTDKNLAILEEILKYFKELEEKYGMQSKNMIELTAILKEK